MVEEQRNPFSRKLLATFVALGIVAMLALAVDRYIHSQRRSEALAELAAMGLNHEFGEGSDNGISFYSTGALIDNASKDVVLRHLKTLSAQYNGGFRFGYNIDEISFSNATPEEQLINDLRGAFPKARLELQDPERG